MEDDSMAGLKFKPIRIVLELATPIALYQWPWIHFDGILEHLLLLDTYGEAYYRLPTERVDVRRYLEEETGIPAPPTPLATYGDIYMASVTVFDPPLDYYLIEIYKRPDIQDIAEHSKRRKRLSMASGPLRLWTIRLATIPARRIIVEATGDPDIIHGVLERQLYSVGAKRRLGFGRVKRITVEEIDWPYAGILLSWTRKAARPIPVRLLKQWNDAAPMAVRPPYWDPRNVELAAPPWSEVMLA